MSADRADAKEIPPCGCAMPGAADADTCYCGVDDLLRVIRRRYSLAVMNAIHTREPARYRDLEAALPGISSSTLAETLHALEAARLADRHELADAVPRTTYTLTRSGTELLSRLRRLLDEVREP